jgi:hypothetical protein
VSLRSGTTLLTNLVAAGEIPLAIDIYADTVVREKKKERRWSFMCSNPQSCRSGW